MVADGSTSRVGVVVEVFVGRGVNVAVGSLVKVGVQVGGSSLWEVGVAVGSSNITGTVGGGNGLSPDCGLTKIITKYDSKQTAPTKTKMVNKFQSTPVPLPEDRLP
jgi:hypothetical protein